MEMVNDMAKTLYGDGFIALGLRYADIGHYGELHKIFDWAVKHGAKPDVYNQHPINVFQRVLNALDRDERFKKEQITYPGIYDKPCRCFSLKDSETEE